MTNNLVSKHDLQYIIDNADQPMFAVDENGKYVYMNRVAAKYLNGTKDQFIGKKISEVIPAQYSKYHETLIRKAMRYNKLQRSRASSYVNNKKIWVEAQVVPVKHNDTEQKLTFVILQDITKEVAFEKELEKRKDALEKQVQAKTKHLKDANDKLQKEVDKRKKAEEKLTQSLRHIQALYEGSRDGYAQADLELNITKVNKAFQKITGYSAKELQGLPINKITHPKYRKAEEDIIRNDVMKRGYSDLFEKEYIRKDGSVIPIEVQIYLLKSAKGTPEGFWAFARDITARKQQEKALFESEQRFRSLVENTTDFIWEVDQNGLYTYVSPKIKDILGYEPDQLMGRHASDFLQPNQRTEFTKVSHKILKSKKPFSNIITKVPHKDGRLIILETSGEPIIDKNGKLLGYRGVDRDITERKKAEEEIQKSRDHLKKIINSTSEIIVVVDAKGTIQEWNQSAANFTGVSRSAVINKSVINQRFPQRASPITSVIKQYLSGKERRSSDFEIKLQNHKHLLCSMSRIYNTDSMESGKILVARDITDRKMGAQPLRSGHAYVDFEGDHKTISSLISSKELSDHKKIVITRQSPLAISASRKENVEFLFMIDNEKASEYKASSPKEVLKLIKSKIKNNKSLIIVNALSFVNIKYGSQTMLEFVIQLSDMVRFTKNILVIQTRKDALSRKEQAIINEELELLPKPSAPPVSIDPKKIEILRFIYYHNMKSFSVHSNMLARKFGIPRQTITRWLKELELFGLVSIQKVGKVKQLFVSDKGKKLV